MLVDSSVWIAFLRGDAAAEVETLIGALERGEPVWLAPPILQEVLQGAEDAARFARWDRVLGELPLLAEPDARATARAAAHLYARCRWAGVTPRSSNDCLIALYAIGARMPLLQRDRDFLLIAGVEPRLALLPAAGHWLPAHAADPAACGQAARVGQWSTCRLKGLRDAAAAPAAPPELRPRLQHERVARWGAWRGAALARASRAGIIERIVMV